ncbi:MAG: hypothetical protein KJI71_00560 [Patescibacteria group bacterium]|nr:hypothetical protein [Patescibacteria group bacterium]
MDVKELSNLESTVKRYQELVRRFPNDKEYQKDYERLSQIVDLYKKNDSESNQSENNKNYLYCVNCGAKIHLVEVSNCTDCNSSNLLLMSFH